LDGLDELPPDISYSKQFYKQIVNLPGRKVITARTAVFPALREVVGEYKHREYEIMGLKPTEQQEFLEQVMAGFTDGESVSNRATWLFQNIQGNVAVRMLAGNPLMLTLIAETATGQEEMTLPQSRSQFYQKAIEKLWNQKLKVDREAQRLRKERDEFLVQKAQAMGMVALRTPFDADGPLERGLRISGLVRVNDEEGTFEFLHLTFQEYYLAKALSKCGLQIALQEHWSDPRYEETLGLLVSILHREGRFGEIKAGLSWLIEWGKTEHERDPSTLWNIGRSPLRTVFHVLGRSAVSLNPEQVSHLKAAIEREVKASAGRRCAMARDIATPAETLARLASDEDPDVRRRVAEKANTPAETLARLAPDQDRYVRSDVAANANTLLEDL
jgi:hypothetical protein